MSLYPPSFNAILNIDKCHTRMNAYYTSPYIFFELISINFLLINYQMIKHNSLRYLFYEIFLILNVLFVKSIVFCHRV